MNPILNFKQWQLNEAIELSQQQVSQADMQKAEKISSCTSSCFDAKKYPNLALVTKGSVKMVTGLILIKIALAGEVFSFGIGTIPATLLGIAGAARTGTGLIDIYKANISKIDNELEKLVDCIFADPNVDASCKYN